MYRYAARVCAAGTEADMIRLLRAMLITFGDDPEELPGTLRDLQERVALQAHQNSSMADDFLYEMVAGMRFGDAEADTLRLSVAPSPSGQFTACFAYESSHPFQVHDWLELHRKSGQLPMIALQAGDEFMDEKGCVILAGNQVSEDWSMAPEIWLWLTRREELFGVPPKEASRVLRRIQDTLEEEFSDRSITEILDDLTAYLERLAAAASDTEALKADRARAVADRDFNQLYHLLSLDMNAALWEIQHIQKWRAALAALRER